MTSAQTVSPASVQDAPALAAARAAGITVIHVAPAVAVRSRSGPAAAHRQPRAAAQRPGWGFDINEDLLRAKGTLVHWRP